MLSRYYDYIRYELNRAPLTLQAYKTDISQFCSWLSPDEPEKADLVGVTPHQVRAWLASLSKNGVIPRSLRRKIISLRSLYQWMLKNEYIRKSPLAGIQMPKIPKPLPDMIKSEEIESAIAFLNEQTEENDPETVLKSLVLEMLFSLGIRRAELVALDDRDISFFKGELKVTGKRSKQRIVPLPEKLMASIKRWLDVRGPFPETPGSPSPLFVVKGKRITPQKVYSIVHEALGDSSARKKSPHALRHSFASAMLNGGADIDTVREFLGHSSLATTQIYTHISLREMKKAYNQAHPRSGRDSYPVDSKPETEK